MSLVTNLQGVAAGLLSGFDFYYHVASMTSFLRILVNLKGLEIDHSGWIANLYLRQLHFEQNINPPLNRVTNLQGVAAGLLAGFDFYYRVVLRLTFHRFCKPERSEKRSFRLDSSLYLQNLLLNKIQLSLNRVTNLQGVAAGLLAGFDFGYYHVAS